MYELLYTENAKRQLGKLDHSVQRHILAVLERSRTRPEEHFIRMVGSEQYRLRAGDYRVIADINRQQVVILVIHVGHRRNIYK